MTAKRAAGAQGRAVTGRSDRAGHERKALGHRWSAGLILAGSLECTKAHWPVPADGDVMLSVIIKVQCRRGLGEALKPADAALPVRTGDHVVAVECWWEVPGERKAPPAGALEARPSPAAGRSDARGRQGRAVHNVYVDQHRGALIVVWAAQMGRSMSARASALDVVGAITRDAPEPAFPLQSWRLPGVVLLRRRLAPGRAVGGESYEGGHNDEV